MSQRRERAMKRRERLVEGPPVLSETKRTVLLVMGLAVAVLGVLVMFGIIPIP